MKVGIITFHDANNYGAVLQAYALQKMVENLGEKVEIIDYKQEYIINKYRPINVRTNNVKGLVRSIISTVLNYKKKSEKKKVFDEFRNGYMNISKKSYLTGNEITDFDALISGSDQVWNTKITNGDTTFFLDINNSEHIKKISYAASIGTDSLSDLEKSNFSKLLNNFNYISVRESNAVNLLSRLTSNKITRVLDPTLAITPSYWHSITEDNDKEEYIFLYAVGEIHELSETIRTIQNKLNLKVIILSDKNIKNVSNAVRIFSPKPTDFLNLIKNASFVVTNSFHGTAFSIVFEKKFITIPHKTSGSRMRDLLNILNLNERIIENASQLEEAHLLNIDYNKVRKILESERNQSLQFLEKSLNNEEI